VVKKWDDPEYRRAYHAAYRAAHREKKAAYAKAYREANRERLCEADCKRAAQNRAEASAKSRAWYQANRARAQATRRAWYAANRAKMRDYNVEYRAENAERLAAYDAQEHRRARVSAYVKANPEKNRERGHRRRAAIRGRPVEKIDHMERYEADEGICGLCGEPVDRETFTLDHIIPIARGGAHVWANVHIAHRTCNAKKGAKIAEVLYSL